MVLFGGCKATKLIKCEVEVITSSFTFTILSPFFKPAFAAGPVFNTSATTTPGPLGSKILTCSTGNKLIPSQPRTTRPSLRIEFSTCWQILAGMAKPIPKDPPD